MPYLLDTNAWIAYLIAAIAQANALILVTHNTAEFGRISSLRLEVWQP